MIISLKSCSDVVLIHAIELSDFATLNFNMSGFRDVNHKSVLIGIDVAHDKIFIIVHLSS